MKSSCGSKNIQDLNHYGIDISGKLEAMLVDELSKAIDKEILKGLGIELDKNKRRKTSIGKIKVKCVV